MSKRPFSWQDRYPDQVTCMRCLEVKDKQDFDRLLWCDDCRAGARVRAARIGWIGGIVIGVIVSAYIWLTVQPSSLIPQLWLAIPLAVVWLGARFVREIAYGAMRFRNARATDAVPPSAPPQSPTDAGEATD